MLDFVRPVARAVPGQLVHKRQGVTINQFAQSRGAAERAPDTPATIRDASLGT